MARKQGNPPTTHTVEAGDTLFDIAQAYYGDGNQWQKISAANGNIQPQSLQIGQQLQILAVDTPPPNPPSPPGDGFAGIVSRQIFEAMFPNRNSFYSYDGLVSATQKYPSFCNEGSDEQHKREATAFLANIAHETGDLKYIEELNTANWTHYCDPANNTYPCVQGKTYHGRGPIQLSWNYNYGACGAALGIDLLNNPDLVAKDSSISFMTALWFWMTPQSPKPSCHNAISTSGFGMTINIINGGIECGKGQVTPQAQSRIKLYKQFAQRLGVTPGENLSC
ncbi:glycoside hydrolase family 19 protein [Calothrix sp. CCY 0018]|uniref:glycoside hydrolase family 19 protein n=1 Tax=Calothrix sp. CCY 0018 TaxID=3103864 RepID=UPI0039C74516